MLAVSTISTTAALGAVLWGFWSSPAPVPVKLEYLSENQPVIIAQQSGSTSSRPPATNGAGLTMIDLGKETVGTAPKAFVPVVGNWVIGQDGDKRVLVVDGRKWSKGQTASGIADRARFLYGERYAEFLDNVQAFAYFPYADAIKTMARVEAGGQRNPGGRIYQRSTLSDSHADAGSIRPYRSLVQGGQRRLFR